MYIKGFKHILLKNSKGIILGSLLTTFEKSNNFLTAFSAKFSLILKLNQIPYTHL